MLTRPLGLAIAAFLIIMIILSFKTSKSTTKSDAELDEIQKSLDEVEEEATKNS